MTSPPTSGERSTESNDRSGTPRVALFAWLAVTVIQIALSFAARSAGDDGGGDGDAFYRYDLAVSSVVLYGLLIGLTVWIASSYSRAGEALGLRRFALRWLWASFGLVIASAVVAQALEPILHAGEEQGFSPDVWRPDRAAAFAVNAVAVSTIGPFAEELFYRGLGVRVLSAFGAVVAVGGTAILFGLAHGIPVALPPLVFLALGLAWVRLRSGSVWPGVIAHSAFNALGVTYTYFSLQ
jgi:membrane protease YdiL (CAAX protease family)